jgi:hypothetical protein
LSVEAARAYVRRKLDEIRERPPPDVDSDYYEVEEWEGP